MDNYCDNQFGGGFFRGGPRMGRGDMSPLVLFALLEKPMHGYEIIRKLEENSHGFWRPSPGSIYPTLQLLEEQDLVSSKEEGGKKVYSLTAEGRKIAEEKHHIPPHWKEHMHKGKRFGVLKDTVRGLVTHMREIGVNGSDEQIKHAKSILDHAVEELSHIAHETRKNSSK